MLALSPHKDWAILYEGERDETESVQMVDPRSGIVMRRQDAKTETEKVFRVIAGFEVHQPTIGFRRVGIFSAFAFFPAFQEIDVYAVRQVRMQFLFDLIDIFPKLVPCIERWRYTDELQDQ
jgi:hypothetical protein